MNDAPNTAGDELELPESIRTALKPFALLASAPTLDRLHDTILREFKIIYADAAFLRERREIDRQMINRISRERDEALREAADLKRKV